MFRIIILITAFMTTAAQACDDAPQYLELREAIYANDIDGVETLVNAAQDQFEQGARAADDMRCLFVHFTKLRPETFEFVANWHDAYPASPFADAAQAHLNIEISHQIRGPKFARDVYPDALRAFSELQGQAWELAERAYAARPRLIPASDALIKVANANRKRRRSDEILYEVMTTDPNQGTLTRATFQALPGWGGTWKMVTSICKDYAELVPDAPEDAVTRCKLPQAYWFDASMAWADKTLSTGAYPEFDNLRLHQLTYEKATREQAEIAYRVMSAEGYRDKTYLYAYDTLAAKYDLPLLTETISKRRHAYAERKSPHNPLMLKLINMLEEPVSKSEKSDDEKLTTTVLSRPTAEQELDLANRRVQAAPYDPKAWTNLVTQRMRAEIIVQIKDAEPYRANAVVYANHSAAGLQGYLMTKFYEYDAYKKTMDGTYPAEMKPMFEGLGKDDGFLCPIVRAARLHEAVCADRKQHGCLLVDQLTTAIASIRADTKDRDVCQKERADRLKDLAFTPTAIE